MRLMELKICYVEQFGFDVVIGAVSYLTLNTVISLKLILEDELK